MQKSSRGGLERQRLRIERRRQVAHVKDVLPEAADVLARIGAEAADQGGRNDVPSPFIAARLVVMSTTLEIITALATRLAYLSCFSCAIGSPLLITGPPNETQSRDSLKA